MTDGAGEGGGGDGAPAINPLIGEAGAPAIAAGDEGAAGAGEGGGGDPWFASLPDDAADDKTLSDRKWAENKKYPDVPSLVKAMRGLEATLGGEKVPVPKSADDSEGWDRLYKAIGRPDAPEGYKFDAIPNADPALTGAFAPVAHKLGLTQAQAEGIASFNEAMVAEQAKATTLAHRAEVAELKRSYGGDDQLGQAMERSMRAAERFGLNGDQLAAMRGAIGPKALVTMLDTIGKAMGEDSLEGGGRKDMELTADKAEKRKAEIMLDKTFQKRLQDRDKAALAEWAGINAALAAREEAKAA